MSELAAAIARLATHISNSSDGCIREITQDGNFEGEAASISEACRALDALVTPPEVWLNRIAGSYNYCAALCLALDLGIHEHLSEQETVSLQALSAKCGAAEPLLSIETVIPCSGGGLTFSRISHVALCRKIHF